MSGERLYLGLDLLDHQVVDREGVDCGNVDDLELEGTGDGGWRVAALLIGPGAWPGRLGGWSGRLAGAVIRRLVTGDGVVRVPVGDIVDVGAAVGLAHDRAHYGLDQADERVERRVMRFIPGREG